MSTNFYTILRGETKSLAIVSKNTRLVALQPAGERTPFFMAQTYPHFIDVVKLIGTERPVLSLIAQKEDQSSQVYSIVLEAAAHLKTILERQPEGPYMLGGCCSGGIVAYEIAQQLQALGHEVGMLVLFDTPNFFLLPQYSGIQGFLFANLIRLERTLWGDIPGWLRFKKFTIRQSVRLKHVLSGTNSDVPPEGLPPWKTNQFDPAPARAAAVLKYRPAPYSGRVLLFKRHRGINSQWRHLGENYGWDEMVRGGFEVCLFGAASHPEMFESEADRALVAQRLRRCFDDVDARSAGQISFHRTSDGCAS